MDLRSGKQVGEESEEENRTEEQISETSREARTWQDMMREMMVTIKEVRKEDMQMVKEGRKEDMKTIVILLDEKVEKIKEEIRRRRRESLIWKEQLQKDMKKPEEKIETIEKRTADTEQNIIQQDRQIQVVERKTNKNTQNIQQIRQEVNIGINYKREEWESTRNNTTEQIEEMKNELKRIREARTSTRMVCQGESKIHKFNGRINKLHPEVFMKSIKKSLDI